MKFAYMEANNITAAPQAANVNALYDLWRETNAGNMEQFYKFLTTPSIKRNEFINAHSVEITFSGSILMLTVKP